MSNPLLLKIVPWFSELLRFSLPVEFPRLLIYCTVPKSILTIDSSNLNTVHFIVLKGLNLVCLCNLVSSSENSSIFLKNAHVACPIALQQVNIYSKNDPSGNILVTISQPNEVLPLLEISKIRFLKNKISFFSEETLREFPLPISQIYSRANIVNLTFSRYGSRENLESKCPMNIRSCVKNCFDRNTLTKILKCHFNGSSIRFTHREWYDNCYTNGECHERHKSSIV